MSAQGSPGSVRQRSKIKSVSPGCLLLVFVFCTLGSVVQAEVLTPPYFNLAERRKITATATCGDEGPELYCKLVGANAQNDYIHVIQGQVCDYCDLNSTKRHPPEYAVDGMETWWQSPPLSRGMKFNEVNLTIDLGQEFHVAYVFLRMGNSPRPGLWALEKSSDYGKTYTPWQYFSDSIGDCETHFGRESLLPITRDDSVICNTEYSKIVPLEGGEIPISLLNNRPSSNMYFNSSVLQEWTRATNVRLRLLRTKTLLGHLMSVERQDPTVTRRYFYSIKDISIGGRCMCNGHAMTCDIPDPVDPNKLQCRCQHHTCGPQCERCCPGFEQKAWRQSQQWEKFVCEPCNCFNHSTECEYDSKIDAQRLSLDIHGNYEGGGICKNCQHNTQGINCNKCIPRFFKPAEKDWNEIDVCQPCNCDHFYSTGNCAENTGRCECRKEFQSPLCNSCSYGYFDYPDCKPCICNLNGTDGDYCEPSDGICPCKSNYGGNFCETCAASYYNFPKCEDCKCASPGSLSPVCDQTSGNCTCRPGFAGRACDRCEVGFFNYPSCTSCFCVTSGTLPENCNNVTGECLCKEGFGGTRCDQCLPEYYSELRDRDLTCVECKCSINGSTSTVCDALGKCTCLFNFAGKQCDRCSPGHYNYPKCDSCNCDTHGAIGITCDSDGQCQCKENFDNFQCSICKEGYYNFPLCEECNCDPKGVIQSFAGCGSVPAGELCQCKERVHGRICDQCRPLFWNLQQNNELGCQECECNRSGSQSGIGVCDSKSGNCVCKYSVGERNCDTCIDGTYNLSKENVFGCTDCSCDIGGSVNNVCNKESGQCTCKPRVTGLRCNEPIDIHYFPTLHQFQYEVEDGMTPSESPVRYAFSQEDFPGYSWKGYAVFSLLQNEVRQEVYIEKSSVYRMILRYVNPGPNPIMAKILMTPENPESETEQSFDVLLKPTTAPRFVTVSGANGKSPSPFVLNPTKWMVTIKTDKILFLDYFVLIPSAYYEATVLTQNVENPCIIGEKGLCRHFGYPNISSFDSVRGAGSFVVKDGERTPIEIFVDQAQLNELQESNIPLVNNEQQELSLDLTMAKVGDYIYLVDYITPVELMAEGGGEISVSVQGKSNQAQSTIVLDACPYTFSCHQALLDDMGRIQIFNIDDNYIRINIKGQPNTSAGIKSIVAVPYDKWHLNYIKPQAVCLRKNGKCIQSEFPVAPDSKKIVVEPGPEGGVKSKPWNIYDNTTELLYLNAETPVVDVNSKVPYEDQYVFIVQYYQPSYPESEIEVLIQNGQYDEGILRIKHCPSTSGCRSVVKTQDGNIQFPLTENFLLTLKEISGNEVWIDYILVLPANQYTESLLSENRLDQTREFISTCGNDHFHINVTDNGFCRKAVFSLTADYNNGAAPCGCHYLGSRSFNCSRFGGQCDCKPNIIGRKCEACKTGFYGFPDCKPCSCPSTALCEKETGECICPTRVMGSKCDQCMPLTYGFDPIIGCEECNCDSAGVEGNRLQCDLFNGSCSCKTDVVGRACDQCAAGHFSFPECFACDCNIKGSTPDICDQKDSACFCKSNVEGPGCDSCIEGTFNLRDDNDAGCTKCFCFGKAIRCNSANLYWTQINDIKNWSLAITPLHNISIEILDEKPQQNDNRAISAEEVIHDKDKIMYFVSSKEYLGNKLASYGGNLNYTIYYTMGNFGKAVSQADVILKSSDTWLMHYSIEQPPVNSYWTNSLPMEETQFVTMANVPATRELMMTVLENLTGIYIRSTYWESGLMTKLQDVSLDTGVDFWNKDSKPTNTVEQCECPDNYKGNSCEECADGYYRILSGPHGGYCVPCQCNGHANTCDVNTGVCIDCQHDTYGDYCEKCIEGYHGNATQKTPSDCLICACPLPITSNNFATGCEFSPDGDKITCDCVANYIGAQCESCAPGFYGRPRNQGDYCKPCECSGNINTDDPYSCDTVTGDCLKCMNNTSGIACNLCQPGYFGDAVVLKDCQACMCDEIGMDKCDSYFGTCVCKPGVVGEKCDRCEKDHWGFDSGNGCSPCNCSVASHSTQCDDTSGQCKCKPGVTGKHCDKCAQGFWNFTSDGCIRCGCNIGYSHGLGCNASTGHCECLPGVIGEKCDHCPIRNVLIPEEGCKSCDSCVHDLLNSSDDLENLIDPVMKDFKNKASGYFTAQRLVYIDDKFKTLNKSVELINPNTQELQKISDKINEIETNTNNLERKIEYAIKDAEKLKKNADLIGIQSKDVYNDIKQVSDITGTTVGQIEQLALNLEVGEGPLVESALTEARQIFSDLKAKDFSPLKNLTEEQDKNASIFLAQMKNFTLPVKDQTKKYDNIHHELNAYNNKLEDLLNFTKNSEILSEKVEKLNKLNRGKDIDSKIKSVLEVEEISQKNLKEAQEFLKNASQILNGMKNKIKEAEIESNNGFIVNNQINQTFIAQDPNSFQDLKNKAEMHRDYLLSESENLIALLKNADNNPQTENAVKAASAYSDIVKEINKAYAKAKEAEDLNILASDMWDGLNDRSAEMFENNSALNDEVNQILNDIPNNEYLGAIIKSMEEENQNLKNIINDTNKSFNLTTERIKEQSSNFIATIDNVNETTETSGEKAKEALQTAREFNTQEMLAKTKNVSSDYNDIINSLEPIKKQLDTTEKNHPAIANELRILKDKQNEINETIPSLQNLLNELKEKIVTAKDTANRVKVGMTFNESTILHLPLPDNVDEMLTTTHASLYFRTPKENGFLMYLGNLDGTKLRRTRKDDFMALEIENGFPVLTMDIGSGFERIQSDTFVSDDQWRQVIVDRVGRNVNFTIKKEDEPDSFKTVKLNGSNTILSLTKDQSKLFVGGYNLKPTQKIQDVLRFSSFEGQVEDLVIGDTPIGLWNFMEGVANKGAKERNTLLDSDLKQSDGFRFDGDGYVVLDARSYKTRDRISIQISFKSTAKDGLIFLMGKGKSFLSLEMREGRIFLQFRLGGDVLTIGSMNKYNDGKFHTLTALRSGRTGSLAIERDNATQDANGEQTSLPMPDNIYIGGYPGNHNYIEVINSGFDGCIDEITVSGSQIDLNKNKLAFGVTPGCPDKFASSVSITEKSGGYVKQSNVSTSGDFELTLKFKTAVSDGLIFYATNRDQSTGISLSLLNGVLVAISQKIEITSGSNTYNDNQWHVVTITHDNMIFSVNVDDFEPFSTDYPPQPLFFMYGELFIGGVPPGYSIKPGQSATDRTFTGCLGDAIINEGIINFANATNNMGEKLLGCGKQIAIPKAPSAVDNVLIQPEVVEENLNEIPKIEQPTSNLTTKMPPPTKTRPPTTTIPTPPKQTEIIAPTTTPRPKIKLPPPVKPGEGCALGYDPIKLYDDSEGFLFGTRSDSRIEVQNTAPINSEHFSISLDFYTSHKDGGLMFYSRDVTHENFISVYMQKGQVHYIYKFGIGPVKLVSSGTYNDKKWHNVIFNKEGQMSTLYIDNELIAQRESNSQSNPVLLETPFYFGGVGNSTASIVNNTQGNHNSFNGCLNRILINGSPIPATKYKFNAPPCMKNLEKGVFFGQSGGYLKLVERFKVGIEFSIHLDIKSRNSSGLLVSVHGKKDYLILEIVDNSIVLRVENGKGPFEAFYKLNKNFLLCDGKWHTIVALKASNVVSVGVDGIFGDAGIGEDEPHTDTKSSLFIGGHPNMLRGVRGAKVRTPFFGCMRNIVIRNKKVEVPLTSGHKNVLIGLCPTD